MTEMPRKHIASTPGRYDRRAAVAALRSTCVLLLVALCAPSVYAAVQDDGLSAEDRNCLKCHSFERLSKNFADGDTLSLHVAGEDFAKSVHHWIGCSGCHRDIDLDVHSREGNRKQYATKREYSIILSNVCLECHEDKFLQYKGSIHASLIEAGNLAAPVCTDCHGSHTVGPKATYETLSGVPCKQCHENVFNTYLESTHGQVRSQVGHIQAPICADCHRAHNVETASIGDRLKDACIGCHEGAKRAHKEWLPNAGLHLQAVSCAACHAPAARRKVDLMLYDGETQRPLFEKEVLPHISTLRSSDAAGGHSLNPVELWKLVRAINQEGVAAEVVLRGRMAVATGVDAHQLMRKDKAIRDCNSCHTDGAEPFQSVTVSMIQEDGRRARYDADKEVLSSTVSINSVGGFYALGGTRIKLLDVLLILVVLGGASLPILHMTMRRLFKNDRLKGVRK